MGRQIALFLIKKLIDAILLSILIWIVLFLFIYDNAVVYDVSMQPTLNRTSGSTESFTGSDRVNSSNSSTEDVTTNKDRSGSHSGNIGNITSQKMINEEIKLWKWNYMREILDDLKEFCALPVYLNATEWQII